MYRVGELFSQLEQLVLDIERREHSSKSSEAPQERGITEGTIKI